MLPSKKEYYTGVGRFVLKRVTKYKSQQRVPYGLVQVVLSVYGA